MNGRYWPKGDGYLVSGTISATNPKRSLVPHRPHGRAFPDMTISGSTKLKVSLAVLVFFVVSLSLAAEQWAPPQNPDPEEIRRGADKDARDGRFEIASQKYVWYHENALRYRPSLFGVRVSFALLEWRRLADQYPPALQEMIRIRNRAEEWIRSAREDVPVFQGFATFQRIGIFQDASALNRTLNEDVRTVELFKWLDKHDPEFAHLAYIIAQDALVDAEEYALCETYLTGRNSFDEILEEHKALLETSEKLNIGQESASGTGSFNMIFARKAAYIVAILVNLDRLSDAKPVAERALQELEDEGLRSQIGDALQGKPPQKLM